MTDTHTVNGTADQASVATGWMSDVQRAIALILIGAFSFVVVVATVRLVLMGDLQTLNDMAKTLQAALVNMSLIALGFFFGSNLSKTLADAGQQKIVDKLTSAAPGTLPPPPTTPPSAAWWGKLTDDEKNAIAGAKTGDARIDAIVTAAISGTATADDLAYLVSKNLITQARADALKAG